MTVNGTGVHQVNMDFTALMVYNLLVVALTSNIDNFQIAIGLNLKFPELLNIEFLCLSNQINFELMIFLSVPKKI